MARPPTDLALTDDPRPTPSRRSESPAAARGHARRRGLAWVASGETWANGLRTLAWLAPLTLLIWVYAEREQTVHTPVPIGVAVRVRSTRDDRFVELTNGSKTQTQTQTVYLRFSGPATGVDEVKTALGGVGLTIDIGSRRGLGTHQRVSVIDEVRDQTLFKAAGVSIDEANPSELEVDIDEVVDRPATVAVDPGHSDAYTVATFEPPTVQLHGPRHQLDALTDDAGRLVVYVDPGKLDEAARGTPVPVKLPVAQDQVRWQPRTVKATLSARAADKTAEIRSVPIRISASADTLRQYEVVPEDNALTLPFVHVVGPAQQVDALVASGNLRAELSVDPEDVNRKDPKPLYFVNLPPGVTLAPHEVVPPVAFTMRRRGDPNGGG